MTPEMIKSRLRRQKFVREFAGVYRLSGVPTSWRQKVQAVALWGGDDAVVSHATAAKLWRFPVTPKQIEITVPHKKEAPRRDIRVHRGVVNSRVSIEGIPVTNPSRTLLDIAGRVEPTVLETMVDDAITRRLTTPAALEWELCTSGGQGRFGSRAFRAALAHLSEGHCESPLESKILRVLLKAGLPPPKRQFEIAVDGDVVRVDFAYPAAKLAIEVDGFQHHSSREAFDADRRRDSRLRGIGWQVLRVSDRMLEEPEHFIRAVETSLGTSLF